MKSGMITYRMVNLKHLLSLFQRANLSLQPMFRALQLLGAIQNLLAGALCRPHHLVCHRLSVLNNLFFNLHIESMSGKQSHRPSKGAPTSFIAEDTSFRISLVTSPTLVCTPRHPSSTSLKMAPRSASRKCWEICPRCLSLPQDNKQPRCTHHHTARKTQIQRVNNMQVFMEMLTDKYGNETYPDKLARCSRPRVCWLPCS
jgi:hypothetical protein